MSEANLIGLIGTGVVMLVIGYFVTNWWHQVSKRVRIQKAQFYLLAMIAEKLGVESVDLARAADILDGRLDLEEIRREN